jgi:DnaJ-class molecular chaperone
MAAETIVKTVPCTFCKATGKKQPTGQTCDVCKGSGQMPIYERKA